MIKPLADFPIDLDLATDLNRENGEYPQVLAKGFVEFEEAVSWIAWGSFTAPSVGVTYLLAHTDLQEQAEEGYRDIGRSELANELLIGRLRSEGATLWGVVSETDRPRLEGEKQYAYASRRTVLITADLLAGFDGDRDDDIYWIREIGFERLLLEADLLFKWFEVDGRSAGDRQVLQSEQVDAFIRQAHPTPENQTQIKRGRPPKWDWNWLMIEIVALANQPDGLPEKQSELEDWAAQLFQGNLGQEPSGSLIRKKVGPIYQRLRSKSQK
jgi:hypothetical protein